MTAYSRGMSTTETRRLAAAPAGGRPSDDCPTAAIPAVPVRRSILHPARPALQDEGSSHDEGAPFAGWRGRAMTEELPAVPAPRRSRPARRSACRHSVVRRHLRAALVGTLLAVVAVTGLSAYAAAGVADALSTAPCQARTSCR